MTGDQYANYIIYGDSLKGEEPPADIPWGGKSAEHYKNLTVEIPKDQFDPVSNELKAALNRACEGLYSPVITSGYRPGTISAHCHYAALDARYNLWKEDERIELIHRLYLSPYISRIGVAPNTFHVQIWYPGGNFWDTKHKIYFYGLGTVEESHSMGCFTDRDDPFLKRVQEITGTYSFSDDYWHGDPPADTTPPNQISPPAVENTFDTDRKHELPSPAAASAPAKGETVPPEITRALEREDGLIIGDLAFTLPPQAVTSGKRDDHMAFPTIRTEGNPKVRSQSSPISLSITLTFADQRAINNEFRRLIAMFKRTPFVPIYNKLVAVMVKPEIQRIYELNDISSKTSEQLNEEINKRKEVDLSYSQVQTWVALSTIGLATLPDAVDAIQVTLGLDIFNYLPYSKNPQFVRNMEDARVQAEYLDDLDNPAMEHDDIISKYKINQKGGKIPIRSTSKAYHSTAFRTAYSTILEEWDPEQAAKLPYDYPMLERYDRDSQKGLSLTYFYSLGSFKDMADRRKRELQNTINQLHSAITVAEDLGAIWKAENFIQAIVTKFRRIFGEAWYTATGHNLKLMMGREIKKLISADDQQLPIIKRMMDILDDVVTVPNSQILFQDNRTGKYTDFSELLRDSIVLKDSNGNEVADKDGRIQIDKDKGVRIRSAFSNLVDVVMSQVHKIYTGEGPGVLPGIRDRIDIANGPKTVLNGVTASYSNKMVPISTVATIIPTAHHMGVGEWLFEISIKTMDLDLIAHLRQMMTNLDTTSMIGVLKDPELAKYIDSRIRIEPEGHLLRCLGIRKALVRDINVSTIPDGVGFYDVALSFVQNDIDIGSYEAIKSENRIPKGIIYSLTPMLWTMALIHSKDTFLAEVQKSVDKGGSIPDDFWDIYENMAKVINAFEEEFARFNPEVITSSPYWNDVVSDLADKLYKAEAFFPEYKIPAHVFWGLSAIALIASGGFAFVATQSTITSALIAVMKSPAVVPVVEWLRSKFNEKVRDAEKTFIPLIIKYIAKNELEKQIIDGLENPETRKQLFDAFPAYKKMWDDIEKNWKYDSCYPDLCLPVLDVNNRKLVCPPDFYFAAEELIDMDIIAEATKRLVDQMDFVGQSAVIFGSLTYQQYKQLFQNENFKEMKNQLDKMCGGAGGFETIEKFLAEVDKTCQQMVLQGEQWVQNKGEFYRKYLMFNKENYAKIVEIQQLMRGLAHEMVRKADGNGIPLGEELITPETKKNLGGFAASLQKDRINESVMPGVTSIWERMTGKGSPDLENEPDILFGDPSRKHLDAYHDALQSAVKLSMNDDNISAIRAIADFWGMTNRDSAAMYREQMSRIIRARRHDRTLRMVRAFPTFRLYFIDEDRAEWLLFDDFYSYSAIKSISVISSKHAISKTAVIELSNITGKLTNIHRSDDKLLGNDKELTGNPDNDVVDSMMLRPGCSIMIKLGYSADPVQLPVVFQGTITELNPGDIVEVIAQGWGAELTNPVDKGAGLKINWNDLAKGYGDVASKILDKTEGLEHLGMKRREDIFFGSQPEEKLRELGITKYKGILLRQLGLNNLSQYLETDNPRDENIYMQYSNNMNPFFHTTFDWRVGPGKSAIEALNDLAIMHPNYMIKVFPYNDIYNPACSDIRMTLYVGPKDGYYKYTDDPFSVETRRDFKKHVSQNELRTRFLEKNEQAAAYHYIKQMKESTKNRAEETRFHKHPMFKNLRDLLVRKNVDTLYIGRHTFQEFWDLYTGNTSKLIFFEVGTKAGSKGGEKNEVSVDSESFQEAVDLDIAFNPRAFESSMIMSNSHSDIARSYFSANPWYRPVVKHHLINGLHHIISNKMVASAENMHNTVTLNYADEPSDGENVPASKFNQYTVFANLEIDPDHLRIYNTTHGNIDTNWFDRLFKFDNAMTQAMTEGDQLNWFDLPSYVRVANNVLSHRMAGMYTGEVTVIGDPNIDSWDIVYMDDPVADVHGCFEAEQVIHRLDVETGFTTTIRPNLITSVRNPGALIDTSYISKVFSMANLLGIRSAVNTGLLTGIGALNMVGLGAKAGTTIGAWGAAGSAAANVITKVSPWALAAVPIYAGYKGYKARGNFIIARGGLMFGQEAINFSPMVYQGRPYTAGLEGYRHDTMMGHMTAILEDMNSINRIGLVNEEGLILNWGKNPNDIMANWWRGLFTAHTGGIVEQVVKSGIPKTVQEWVKDRKR